MDCRVCATLGPQTDPCSESLCTNTSCRQQKTPLLVTAEQKSAGTNQSLINMSTVFVSVLPRAGSGRDRKIQEGKYKSSFLLKGSISHRTPENAWLSGENSKEDFFHSETEGALAAPELGPTRGPAARSWRSRDVARARTTAVHPPFVIRQSYKFSSRSVIAVSCR